MRDVCNTGTMFRIMERQYSLSKRDTFIHYYYASAAVFEGGLEGRDGTRRDQNAPEGEAPIKSDELTKVCCIPLPIESKAETTHEIV